MCKKQKLASLRLKPKTLSVLDWRDNQLHHDTSCLNCFYFILPFFQLIFFCYVLISLVPVLAFILGAIGKLQTADHILRMRSQILSTPSVWAAHVSYLLHHYQVQATKLCQGSPHSISPSGSKPQHPVAQALSIHSAHDCDHKVIHQQFNMYNHCQSAHEWRFSYRPMPKMTSVKKEVKNGGGCDP